MKLKLFVERYGIYICVAAAFAAVAALNFLFPLAGDDMEWTTKRYTLAVITEFNGRYLGTILSMAIVKSTWLRVIAASAITGLLLCALAFAGDGKRWFFFIVGAFLFIIMPTSLFSEVVAWASGFANYMPSALVAVTYLVMVKREFASETPSYCRAMPYLAAALGLIGAFFMETVTIGNVIVGVAVLIYHFIRFKKPSATLIAFLAGAIIGAVLMFLNPVYLSIADGNDPIAYRTFSLANIKDAYFDYFYGYFLYDNFSLNLFLTGMTVWLFVLRVPFISVARRVIISICFLFQLAFLADSGASYFGGALLPNFRYQGAVNGLLSATYFAALAVEVIFLLKGALRLYCIFLIGAILAYTAEMLAVTPITARSFIYSYLIFVLLAMVILGENISLSHAKEGNIARAIALAAVAITVGIFAWYAVRYSAVHSAYVARENEIIRQVNEGDDVILVKRLPVEYKIGDKTVSFVRYANFDASPYAELVLRSYYGIPSDVELVLID